MTDLLDHPVISGRYFYPLDGDFPDPFWVDCGDARLACSYHEVDPAAKTLVHFHGNGEIVADWRDRIPMPAKKKRLEKVLKRIGPD